MCVSVSVRSLHKCVQLTHNGLVVSVRLSAYLSSETTDRTSTKFVTADPNQSPSTGFNFDSYR